MLFDGPGGSPAPRSETQKTFDHPGDAQWLRGPTKPCPHPDCGHQIRDLLAEMVPNVDQASKIPPDPTMTPERWIDEDRMMPGALRGYIYVEDRAP